MDDGILFAWVLFRGCFIGMLWVRKFLLGWPTGPCFGM